MSTKIYTGFRFAPGTTLDTAYETIAALRPKVAKKVMQEQCRFLAIRADEFIDGAILKPDQEALVRGAAKPLSTAWRELRVRQQEVQKTSYRDPAVDFEFTVVLIPVTYKDERHILGMYFCETNGWDKWFLKQPGISEFGYWNNTDQPDGITDAEWAEREALWDVAFGTNRTPAESGLTIQLHPSIMLPPTADQVLKVVRTPEKRAAGLARDIIIESYYVGFKPGDSISAPAFKAREFLATADGKAALNQKITEITGQLPTITKEILMGTE